MGRTCRFPVLIVLEVTTLFNLQLFMNYFTNMSQVWRAKAVALVVMMSMLISAFPVAFFVAEAAAPVTVFSNGFEETPPFAEWTSADNKWQNSSNTAAVRTGARGAWVSGANAANAALVKEVTTESYENLTLSFWYKRSGLDAGDFVTAEWFDGLLWQVVQTIEGQDGNADDDADWVNSTINLPAGADNLATFAFRFRGTMNAGNDRFGLDDVSLTGSEIEVIETPTCSLTIVSDTDDFVAEKNNYAVSTYEHEAWLDTIGTSSAMWIWGDATTTNPTAAETQTFLKKFNWTGGVPTSATLKVVSDNYHTATLGTFVGNNTDDYSFANLATYDVSSAIVAGLNTLSIEVENLAMDGGTYQSNPAGLMYELVITGTGESCGEVVPVEPEAATAEVTICKMDEDTEDELSGWTLMLLGSDMGAIEVPANTPAGADAASELSADTPYVAIASGTWLNDRNPDNYVDAEYSTEDNWLTNMDGFTGYGENILDLQINEEFVNWGPYNSLHTYATSFTQDSEEAANFRMFDGNGTTVEEGWYGDNSGSVDVTLYEGYAGVTGKGGCVTFGDVPFGSYEVAEIDQEGWENVDGLGEVTITEDVTLTVINRLIPETAPLTVMKSIVSGEATPDQFAFMYREVESEDWSEPIDFDETGIATIDLPYGTYDIVEVDAEGYEASYEGCDNVTVSEEQEDVPVCEIINSPIEILTCTPSENLLANGSFEEPVVTNGSLWQTFSEGLGWLVEWVNPISGTPETPTLEFHRGVNGWLSQDGAQHVELDGDWGTEGANDASTRISQTIPTIAGTVYNLDWNFSARPDTRMAENKLRVWVDGQLAVKNSAGAVGESQTNWIADTYQFVGTGEPMEIAFSDAGTGNGLGTFLDNVSLTCEPAPSSGAYCGDEEVNQEWEQCEVGDEDCTEYCLYANQCQDLTLVKVDLTPTKSPSFDNTIYLGDTTKTVPSGVWFPFNEIGDETAESIAFAREGLAIERDQATNELILAVVGGNDEGYDAVMGTLEVIGGTFGDITRNTGVPGFKLEGSDEEEGRPVGDTFRRTTDTTMEFSWRTYGAKDGATVVIATTTEEYLCPDDGGNGGDEDVEVYRIEGNVWHDRDESGAQDDEDEENLGGILVTATNGTTTYSTTTDETGLYYFEVVAGTWIITVGDNEEWETTFPSANQYEVTVPIIEDTPEEFSFMTVVDSILAFVLPAKAYAANIVLATYKGYDFGVVESDGGSSGGGSTGTLVKKTATPTGLVAGISTTSPEGQVLGESLSIMPVGAPNTGMGGGQSSSDYVPYVLLLLAGIGYAIHANRRLN